MGCRKLAEFEPDIWLPGRRLRPVASFARGIGGRASGRRMLNSPVLPTAGFNGQFASLFPGAYQVVQTDLGLTYGGTMLASGTTPPVITLTGSLSTTPVPILVTCTGGGALGVWFGNVSYDNGGTIAQVFTSGATVPLNGLGTGLTLNIAAGTAATDNTWKATCAGLADQSGNGLDYSQATASKQPVVSIGVNGKPELLFPGGSSGCKYLTSLLNLPAPGTTPWSLWAVLRQVAFNSANFTLLTGSGATNVGNLWQGSSAGQFALFNGIAQTPAVALTVGQFGRFEGYFSNSTSDYIKAGSNVATGTNTGNSSTTGRQIGCQQAGFNGANIGLLALVYAPGIPANLAAASAAVTSFYGAGVAV